MAERGSWTIEMGRPEEAIRLPVGEIGDLTAWAEMAARSRIGYDAGDDLVEEYARMILESTADSEKREPILAYLLPLEHEAQELARFEVSDLNPDEEVPEITLDALESFYSQPRAEPVEPPHVVRGDLPCGPAVRIHQRYLTDVDEFGDGTLFQTALYAVRPHGTDFAVVLSAGWRAVLLNEELFALVDELAQSLTVTPA
jgi:hypothetical protein